jgi:hypothetical protein
MPAKINVSKDIKRLYDAHNHVVADLGLYASMALLAVVPKGLMVPEKSLCKTEFSHDKTMSVHFEYKLENIPAHGTWKFTFMFRSNHVGAVLISKCNDFGFNTRSCRFDLTEMGEKTKELAEL